MGKVLAGKFEDQNSNPQTLVNSDAHKTFTYDPKKNKRKTKNHTVEMVVGGRESLESEEPALLACEVLNTHTHTPPLTMWKTELIP